MFLKELIDFFDAINFPFFIKKILLKFLRVSSLWDIEISVFPFNLKIFFNICFSVKESKELVASSKIKISGLWTKALAIPSRCISPPDKLIPRSLKLVFNPFGSFLYQLPNPTCCKIFIKYLS